MRKDANASGRLGTINQKNTLIRQHLSFRIAWIKKVDEGSYNTGNWSQ